MVSAPDRRLALLARTAGHTPARDRNVARFSKLGEHGAVWIAIGAVTAIAWPARRARFARATRAVAAAYALNTAVKLVVRRHRPRLDGLPPLIDTPTDLSFPSAHATTSVAAAALFARAGLPAAPLRALAAALAASRLYLGVHYPSDVIAGAALGGAVARVAGSTDAP